MRTRVVSSCVLAISLSLSTLSAAPASAPAKGRQAAWTGVATVIAVGDVHGDYEQFLKALRAGGAIDEKENWAGGKAHLVQMGDVPDRGPESKKAMDLLMKLEGQAAAAGGAVHCLLGNHEAMVMLGDHRYVTEEEIASHGGPEGFKKAFAPDGTYGRWLRGHDSVIRINDVLYVHGGLSAAATAGKTLEEINESIRANLAAGGKKGPAMNTGGPLWYRGLAEGKDEAKVSAELAGVLARYGAKVMVVGHTPTPKGIQVRAGGRLVMIDVGMSKSYGGPASCLRIDAEGWRAMTAPDRKETLPVAAGAGKAAA